MLRFLGWTLLIVTLDQLSKYWVLTHFQPYQVLPVWPVFNLTLVFNTGAAFSFLADSAASPGSSRTCSSSARSRASSPHSWSTWS